MINPTSHIKRTIAAAGLLAAVTAPAASARVADYVPPSAVPEHQAPAAGAWTMADIAAHHEQIASRSWQQANPSTPVAVSAPADGGDGVDLSSAGIGAAIVFVIVLAEAGGRTVVRRRHAGARVS